MHPPHLIGPENKTMPSALIPFCSYQSKTLGNMIPGYDVLACDSFEQVIFDGRLCYSLKNEMKKGTKQGKRNGLLLMVDPGQIEGDKDVDRELPSFELHIHTLSGFSDSRSGSYAMSALKQMSGTDGFMSLPDDQKRCQIEAFEDCQRSQLLKELQKQCGCIPWTIVGKHMGKVTYVIVFILKPACSMYLSIQVKYCNPISQPCVERVANQNTRQCRTSCRGLHADVTHTDDSFATFVTQQLKEQHTNLADGEIE